MSDSRIIADALEKVATASNSLGFGFLAVAAAIWFSRKRGGPRV